MISRLRALRQWYVGETRGFLHTTDAGVATLVWVIGISCLLVLVGTAMAQAFDYQTKRGQVDMLDATKKQMTTLAAHAYARILPALDSRGQSNCSGGWCRELVLYTREADNVDRYVAFDFDGSKIQQYRFTGLAANGSHQGVTAVGVPVPAAGFQVRVDAASQLATDALNPYGSLMAAVFSSAGMTPNDVQVNFGKPLTVGKNDVVFVHMWNASVGDDFALSGETLPTADLSLTVGYYKPTPAPAIALGGLNGPGGLVYHFPGDPAGPTSFQVSEANYHDAFFAEQQSCVNVSVPSPNYNPATSPPYFPKTMFGQSGPWVYPNPNPITPPGQASGPGTFGVSSQTPGVCTFGLYDTTVNRSGPAKAQVAVQVMGPLKLTVSTLTFATPTSAPQGDSVSKTFDNDAIQVSASGCGGIVTMSVGTAATPGSVSSSPATTSFSVAPAGGFGACDMQLTDQYGESLTLHIVVDGALQVSPTAVVFPDHTQPSCIYPDGSSHNPCVISVSKWGYNAPDSYSVDAASCSGIAQTSTSSFTASGAIPATFIISPISFSKNDCFAVVSDAPIGESVNVDVQVQGPPCPGGQVRSADGSCPANVVVQGSGTMAFSEFCKADKFGQFLPGVATFEVSNPSPQGFTLGPTSPPMFVPVATMTLTSGGPVTFSVTPAPGGPTQLTVSSSATASASFVAVGTWSNNVWTPPAPGTYYVGWVQEYAASPDCNGDGGAGSGIQGGIPVYSGAFSFTGTQ